MNPDNVANLFPHLTPVTATAPQKSSRSSVTPARTAKPPLFEVRRSPIQGRGVFAIAPIRKGKRITEYLGEPITHEEADRRYDDNKGRHHTFLFILDDDTVLDARYQGSDARYINHSCDPNCESVIEEGHIWIEAIKAIKPETELAYDYQFEWQDEYEPEDIRYYACRCGSAKCRGTILKVPAYLRTTVRKWLAGDDVAKPRKPRRGAKKAVVRKVAKKSSKKTGKKAARKGLKKATRSRA
ncbi:MAG TPA: SET domain-containing protein-lysine N-methyltransferase [Gemmatimonas sp.]|nr:SET domain-containing protein-lysine N-methyltransferase [Gemmatimonas sp.]